MHGAMNITPPPPWFDESIDYTEPRFHEALAFLGALGAIAAGAGGASPLKGALRVAFWGALAMALTAGVGRLFGTAV